MHDPNLIILDHPLVLDRMTRLRDKNATPEIFRAAVDECANIIAMEATRTLKTQPKNITTPLIDMEGQILSGPAPLIVPILRAGLALSNAFSKVLPEADTGHVGLYRDEETKRPVQYLVKLPKKLARPIFMVDPMLATGHSMVAAIDTVVSAGANPDDMVACVLIAAPEGVETMRKAYPTMPIITGAMDSHLNDHAYIVPGLGDAGDRYFGTV